MDPVFFSSRTEFRDWLEANHGSTDELWVGYYKADADRSGIGYGESVEEAICFGWIDGLVNGIDDETYKRRFTPRKPDSKWSKNNTERVERMIEAGKMTPAGMELVEAARESGAWADAYRLGDDHEVPPELKRALQANEKAWENFQAFSNTDQHAFIALVTDAKTDETRDHRIQRTVELADRNLSAYDEHNERRL
ncbi:YdeI/OmpD-associated family protein [Halorarum halobium]|uniref:YdeI/OmpD-associated family protein n=1 Tax=Halorarum halobium TaxID=3075121 RepID=UPI0028B0A686|nr:YdeI/OmpD-associated family protein [Halobaculum sp. XH14]